MVCRSGLPESASRIIGGCFVRRQANPHRARHLPALAEDIENLDAVYLNSSPLIGILDRGVAQGPIEGA